MRSAVEERMARNRRLIYLLAAAAVLSNTAGNCMLRAGLKSVGAIVSVSPLDYLKAFLNGWVVLGVVVLFGWLLLQLSLLSWADLTYVLPVTSVSYVLIAIAGVLLMDEHVSAAHWAGVLLILAGVIIVGRTRPLTVGTGENS